MQLGMIGLGRMGANIVRRLMRDGHDCVVYDVGPEAVSAPRTPTRNNGGTTAEDGYLHCGPNGAGHFVKMVHNGIEYGIMAAYAEGFNVLHKANVGRADHEVDAETAPLQDSEYYQ